MAAMEPQVFVIEFKRKNPENRFHGEDKTMAAGFNVPFLLHHAPKNASKHKNLQHQGTTWSSKEENAFGFLRDDMAFVLRAFMTHTKTPFPNSLRISRLCASLRLFVLCNPCQFLGLVL